MFNFLSAILSPIGMAIALFVTVLCGGAFLVAMCASGGKKERPKSMKVKQLPPLNIEKYDMPITYIQDHIDALSKPVDDVIDDADKTTSSDFEDDKNKNDGFAELYAMIEGHTEPISDFKSSLANVNHRKNRYRDILPPEKTRVILKPFEDDNEAGADYINANWVAGRTKNSEKRYIATQGPLITTITDFWRMVWQSNAKVIVNLTRDVEVGRSKCDVYYPEDEEGSEEQQEVHGPFHIKLLNTQSMHDLTVRKLRVINANTESERVVYQYHYIGWPDRGIPDKPEVFLDIIKRAPTHARYFLEDGEKVVKPDPIVVHCSAGVGRTGVFILVHALIEHIERAKIAGDVKTIEEVPVINIVEHLLAMRKARPKFIQNKEQLKFCFIVLNQYFNRKQEV